MADPIKTVDGDRVRYAERDAIGVESDAFERGINAELQFVRDVHEVQTAEHDGMGVHDTPKIARAKLIAKWDGADYALGQRSYLLGEYGSNVASLATSVLSPGEITITLAASLGTVNLAIADASIDESVQGSSSLSDKIVLVMLGSVTSASEIVVRRYEGPDAASLSMEHGDFTILIYAE